MRLLIMRFKVLGLIHMYMQIHTCEFPKIRCTLFGGPYNKDPTIRVLY